MAVESRHVTTDVIEVSEFPEWAERFRVTSVPKVVVDDQLELVGSQREQALVEAVSRAGNHDMV